jgi:superoxide dismutase
MWAKMISGNIMRHFSTEALKKVSLPELKFGYSALEPVISSKLLETHHKKHHQTYVNNLNAALDQFEGISLLTQKPRPTSTTTKSQHFAKQSSSTWADTSTTQYTGKT